MIKQIVIIPMFAVLFLSFATQLMEIAESSSEKSLEFTQDMEKAIDCATRGVEIRECSPGIYKHEFKDEMQETLEANKQFIEDLKETAKDSNLSVEEKDDVIIIKK